MWTHEGNVMFKFDSFYSTGLCVFSYYELEHFKFDNIFSANIDLIFIFLIIYKFWNLFFAYSYGHHFVKINKKRVFIIV